MNETRYLTFEIGPYCNLSQEHEWCPSHHFSRSGKMLSTQRIADCINTALRNGFEGHVAFHFYNEPLLYADRIKEVMTLAPRAKYLLWSNGTLAGDCPELVNLFDAVNFTDYFGDGNYPFAPDARLENYRAPVRTSVKCERPFVEFAVDYTGEAHLCCQDWKNEVRIGNIADEPFMDVYARWLSIAEGIRDGRNVPLVCLSCKGVQPC